MANFLADRIVLAYTNFVQLVGITALMASGGLLLNYSFLRFVIRKSVFIIVIVPVLVT